MARECQKPAPEDSSQSSAKNFFLPRDAFTQLHNLSSYMLFVGASKTVVGCNSDPEHPGTGSWLDGHWSTATCGGIISCSTMVRSTGQAALPSARGCDTDQHDCDMLLNRHSQGCASFGFPCWNRGCERSDAIPGARRAHVDRWKTTGHSAVDINHDHAPVWIKHSNKRKAEMCWKSRMTAERHMEKFVRERWTRAQPAGLLFKRRLETAKQLARLV